MNRYFLLFLTFLPIINAEEDNADILCTKTTCDSVVCGTLPEKCKIQNATHNGLFMPSPTTCNCCQFCMENLNEDDECTIGNPANPSPTSLCGPGLYCKASNPDDEFDGTCARLETDCMIKQNEYDEKKLNGTLGTMEVRQNCDDDGFFGPYKCIPGQTCFCVGKDGTRIFGEADFTTLADYLMQCKCSRDYVTAVELTGQELNPTEHFRCAPNGDYDNLQCFQDKVTYQEKCLCVDSQDGAPTFPDQLTVNISEISKQTLKCYKGKTTGVYYNKCEEEYLNVLKEMQVYETDGYDMILMYEFPKCDLDGTYQAVQENSTHKYCVSKEGEILLSLGKDDTLAKNMDCKCLRAVSIMTTNEKPTCDLNGNYTPMQCRRGICRCVDRDGIQVCKTQPCEVDVADKDTLKCT